MKGYWTGCRHRIFVGKRAENHLKAHPEVHAFLEEAVRYVFIPNGALFIATEVNMGRIIGSSGVKEAPRIKPSDKALFARRLGREHPSRVLTNTGWPATSHVSIIAAASCEDVGVYLLITAWVGRLAKKEPWDRSIRGEEEYENALAFWCQNAFIWTPEIMGEPFESTWEKVLTLS